MDLHESDQKEWQLASYAILIVRLIAQHRNADIM